MQDKDLVVCMKASRLGLSMKEASAYFSIGYDKVEEISNKYAIKFACNRRRANETRAAERRNKKNATVTGVNDREIQPERENLRRSYQEHQRRLKNTKEYMAI